MANIKLNISLNNYIIILNLRLVIYSNYNFFYINITNKKLKK